MRLVVSFRTRGVALGPVALMTACVKCGLNLCSLLSDTAPFEVIVASQWDLPEKGLRE